MSDIDARRGQLDTSAADVYDRFFVPALFARWARPLLEAAGVRPGDRVLDIGCGTGVVARTAVEMVGRSGRVTGVDVNESMLAVARRHDVSVDWRTGAAEALPIDDRCMDRVVSQFVWMFLDDPEAAAHEIRRVLAPGGSATVATWASLEETPGYAAMVGLLRDLVGDEAAEALRAPYCIGAPEHLRSLLTPAFADVTVTRRHGTARFESIEQWVHTDIRGWTLGGAVDDAAYERLLAAALDRLAGFTGADGRVEFDAPALLATMSVR